MDFSGFKLRINLNINNYHIPCTTGPSKINNHTWKPCIIKTGTKDVESDYVYLFVSMALSDLIGLK